MTITTLQKHRNDILEGKAKVRPGQPYRISDAAAAGDGGWQGDLGIVLIESIPDGYRRIARPKKVDAQLVPGNTQGSRHCLADRTSCTLYWPDGWTHAASYDEYLGPVLKCKSDTTITHPTHGDVTIPAGRIVQLHYQRVWDAEQQKERRQLD